MTAFKAPVADTLFILADVLGVGRYANLPGFAEATPDVIEAVLSEAGAFAGDILAPLNAVGDRQGCTRHEDGSVTTPRGFRDAYAKFAAGGWIGLSGSPDYGGQGLPYVLAAAVSEYTSGANMAFTMYPGLVQAAIAAIGLHGSEQQKRLYLPKMMAGTWGGTMNLT